MQKTIWPFYLAAALLPAIAQADFKPVIGLTLGLDNVDVGKTQSLALLPPLQTTYVTTDHAENEPFGGVFLGFASHLNKSFELQYGLAYYQTKVMTVPGNVYTVYPSFISSTYQYQIQNKRYLFESKLLYNFQEIFHPYVTAGIGQAINKSYAYQETAINEATILPNSPYSNNSIRSLTYEVGAGVDVDINRRMRIGAGYRFADLGRSALNPNISTSTNTLRYPHLYTNEAFLQLSTFIG